MKFSSPSISTVTVQDGYLFPRMEANHTATLPTSIQKCEETGRLDAFKLTWKPGDPNAPHVYWDSDVAKVVEGIALELLRKPDPALRKELDRIVALIISAQQPDGYLNTHFTSVEPEKRWTNLRFEHELYCAGHLIEAAVAHFQVTGSRDFLDCMCRYADLIDRTFGPNDTQLHGYPGHEEIELALVKLAAVTHQEKYLRLAQYFVLQRGQSPNFFEQEGSLLWASTGYFQADRPVLEQPEAQGHAVRAVYLYAGMADVADATQDTALLQACERLFDDLTQRKMYVTGGIGSAPRIEAIERSYKLPNALAYAESCAGIGLVLFAQRMHNITGDAKYLHILERALYNNILAGISLSGNEFFYQNPLQSNADSIYPRIRQPWFDCSCCPTNFCRFLPQIGSLLWSTNPNEVRLCIPASSTYNDGTRHIRVTSQYPYDGHIHVEFLSSGTYTFSIRVPDWTQPIKPPQGGTMNNGFLSFHQTWKPGDTLDLQFEMPILTLHANPAIEDNIHKICLQRGPLVYALESIDNQPLLHTLCISPNQEFSLHPAQDLPPGTLAISGTASVPQFQNASLYSTDAPILTPHPFTAIPYALWQNRGPSNMQVWIQQA